MAPVSETESKLYYVGLPSQPPLIARTSTTPWSPPKDSEEAELQRKELGPANHPALRAVWEDDLAGKVIDLLDSRKVKWTSADIVRIGCEALDVRPHPVVLWLGVVPQSLSFDDGDVVAHECKRLLEERGISDVDVEIRESVVMRGHTVVSSD